MANRVRKRFAISALTLPAMFLAGGTLSGCAPSATPGTLALVTQPNQLSASPGPSTRPVVYIASPYSKGDPAINTHFQCETFDRLMNDGKVWPVAPLWSHFQHTMFPRKYEDWVAYDLALIPRYDACLRLNAEHPKLKYATTQSSGADNEVAEFKRLGKPVFYSVEELYAWVERGKN